MVETKKVAFQGTRGNYTFDAIEALFTTQPDFKGQPVDSIEFSTSQQVFDAVATGTVDYALVALENSVCGTGTGNFDLMVQNALFIVGELMAHEQHCLVGLPGTRLEDIQVIQSHPFAIDQCRAFLGSLANDELAIQQTVDTALSAALIKKKQSKNTVAIAGKRAAELYGLEVIKDGIEDSPHTITRYVLLAKKPTNPERHASPKTSISVVLKNEVGTFFKALACFAMRNIQIAKVESRPSSRSITLAKPWEYVVYLDFEGSVMDENVERAIKNLEEFAVHVRVLGSYPRFVPAKHDFNTWTMSM